jgi:hypothetical protein
LAAGQDYLHQGATLSPTAKMSSSNNKIKSVIGDLMFRILLLDLLKLNGG